MGVISVTRRPTIPTTFTFAPAETEPKEPGIGGKPPVDRRPTGGSGGGGGDDDCNGDRRGPGELLQRIRRRVFSVLAADILFFAVLVAIFFARRAGAPMDAGARGTNGDWRRLLPPHIVYLNTVWLLLSSLTMEMARRNIFREIDALEEWLGLGHPALRRCLPWLGATLALGALFLAGQSMAWRQLGARGEVIGQAAIPDGYFYLITGLHAAHLLLGALAIMVCMTALGLLRRIELRQIAVDAVAWFWQTMCGVWLLLFAALALGQ